MERTMRALIHPKSPGISRRSFLKASAMFAGGTSFFTQPMNSLAAENKGALIAYVGTFSSPLHDVLPTQVDLPPGNGRGIHLFNVDRATGAMSPIDTVEM